MFAKIKKFYKLGLYNKEKVDQFVAKGIITVAQYEQIIGEPYQD